MKMEVNKLHNGVKEIVLEGRLDMAGSGEINSAFAIHSASERAPVLVDMSGVDFIDSIAMRMLITASKALTRQGGKMVLLNPQPMVAEVLQITGIDILLPIFDNRVQAVDDLLTAVPQ